VTANPSKAESIVIKYRAESAPIKTTNLLFVMARIAAIKKVLSPISETRMTVIDEVKAAMKPSFPVFSVLLQISKAVKFSFAGARK